MKMIHLDYANKSSFSLQAVMQGKLAGNHGFHFYYLFIDGYYKRLSLMSFIVLIIYEWGSIALLASWPANDMTDSDKWAAFYSIVVRQIDDVLAGTSFKYNSRWRW